MTFAGMIDQLAVQRIFNLFAASVQDWVGKIHLLIQSIGGNVADGVCLYNFFSTFPIPVTAYNSGSVSSAAVIAYLGASERIVSDTATFMIHRSQATLQGAGAAAVQTRLASLIMDDDRCERILHTHLHMPDDKWAVHQNHDLWLDSTEAVRFGLASRAGSFSPPAGVPFTTSYLNESSPPWLLLEPYRCPPWKNSSRSTLKCGAWRWWAATSSIGP